jgi:hypothetical protein
LRQRIGVGTPRGLQGRLIAVLATLEAPRNRGIPVVHIGAREMLFTTGC